MGRAEIAKKISQRIFGNARYENVQWCHQFLDAFLEVTKDGLLNTGSVTIPNFFTIKVVDRPARKRRHPMTNEIVMFPPTQDVVCRLSQSMKKIVK